MQEIALTLSIFLSGASIGAMAYLLQDAHKRKKWYEEECRKLEAIMKAAEQSQLSFAQKILSVEEKLDFLQMTTNNRK